MPAWLTLTGLLKSRSGATGAAAVNRWRCAGMCYLLLVYRLASCLSAEIEIIRIVCSARCAGNFFTDFGARA